MGNIPPALKHCLSYPHLLKEQLGIGEAAQQPTVLQQPGQVPGWRPEGRSRPQLQPTQGSWEDTRSFWLTSCQSGTEGRQRVPEKVGMAFRCPGFFWVALPQKENAWLPESTLPVLCYFLLSQPWYSSGDWGA